MQKATLKVNGKPVDLEITNEQAKAISDAYIKSTKSIVDRINESDDPWAYVLEDQGLTQEDFDKMTEHDDDDDKANKAMKLISKCLNEGPLDPSKPWYYPVFNRDKGAGFGLAIAGCDCWDTDATVGERRSFKSADLAVFAGRKFPHIYKPYMLILQ